MSSFFTKLMATPLRPYRPDLPILGQEGKGRVTGGQPGSTYPFPGDPPLTCVCTAHGCWGDHSWWRGKPVGHQFPLPRHPWWSTHDWERRKHSSRIYNTFKRILDSSDISITACRPDISIVNSLTTSGKVRILTTC